MIEISHQQAQRLLRIALDASGAKNSEQGAPRQDTARQNHGQAPGAAQSQPAPSLLVLNGASLPPEQWSMLQAHLEACAECRAYRDRLLGLERNLRRVLRTGLDSVPTPHADIPAQVLGARHRREARRQRAGQLSRYALGAAVLALVVLAFTSGLVQRMVSSLAVPVTADTESGLDQVQTPLPTSMPTVAAGGFPDVVAYESRRDGKPNGDHEIYLLNPGEPPIDLTNNPGSDTDPAWSPDGEWLAFLSDRSGKPEVYVISLTNNRLVQLTDEPGITWQGPLNWSPDGKQIALSGVRDPQGGQRWVYLVGVDGSGAKALPGSRGGDSPKFAPYGDRLAYTFTADIASGAGISPSGGGSATPVDLTGVIIDYLQTRDRQKADWPQNNLVPAPAYGSAFDWSSDGTGLVYVASDAPPVALGEGAGTARGDPVDPNGQQPADGVTAGGSGGPPSTSTDGVIPGPDGTGSLVMAVRDLSYSLSSFFDYGSSFRVANSHWPGAYRAATWSPSGAVVYLEDLNDARANDKPGTQPLGCWTIQTHFAGSFRDNQQQQSQVVTYSGLCVEGGLDRGSWTPDGRWVVMQARLPGDAKPSLFAMRMPGRGFGGQPFGGQPSGEQPDAGRGFDRTPVPGATPFPRFQGTPRAFNGSFAPAGTIVRLVNDPWVGALPRVRPRLRPFSQPLNINPKPVAKAAKPLPPSDLSQRPGGPPGQILYVVQNNNMSVVVSANPDGTGGKVLAATPYENRCPRWSPDGQTVALISQRKNWDSSGPPGSNSPGSSSKPSNPADGAQAPTPRTGEGIFVMDTNGQNVREITPPFDTSTTGDVSYGCPVWSPPDAQGGPYVASLVDAGQQWYVAVAPTSAGAPKVPENWPQPGMVPIDAPNPRVAPVWSPDGRSVYLVSGALPHHSPEIIVVSVPDNPYGTLAASTYPVDWNPEKIAGLSVDEDGQSVVALDLTALNGPGGVPQAQLLRYSFNSPGSAHLVGAPLAFEPPGGERAIKSNGAEEISGGSLARFTSSTFGAALQGGPLARDKVLFFSDDLSYGNQRVIGAAQDLLYGLAWSPPSQNEPGGRWLIYSTESGLWGLDVNAALTGQAGPVWISPVPVKDLDWR